MKDYAQYQFWFNVLQFGLTCIVGVVAWWRTGEKTYSAKIKALAIEMQKMLEETKTERDKACNDHKASRDRQCNEHKAQTTSATNKLEGLYNHLHDELSHLPNQNEVRELTKSMQHLAERIGNLDGRMSGVNRAVDLINQFLIDQGGKR